MPTDDVPDADTDIEAVDATEDDDGPGAPPVGALRAIGELLAALLTVSAVLAALLVAAVAVL